MTHDHDTAGGYMHQQLISKLRHCSAPSPKPNPRRIYHQPHAMRSSSSSSASPAIPPVFPNGASFRLYPNEKKTNYVHFEDSRPEQENPALIAVCLPGIGDSRRQFRFLAPLLHEQLGCRVFLGDLRGFGDSTEFDEDATKKYSAYSPESLADDVIQLLNELHAKHPQSAFILLGNSLSAGTMVLATTQAKHEGIKLKALVLLGPVLRDSPMNTWFRPLSHVLFRELYGAGIWLNYYKTLYPPGKAPDDLEQEIQLLKTHLKAKKANVVNTGRYARASKANVAAAVNNELGKFSKIPVLAFYGGKDPDYGNLQEELEWIKGAVPHVTCFEDPDGGHYPHVEDAQKVANAIAKIL
jgi:pimeloyl-ACP methyl ester carboxylesterase